jgi:hypothetical protein
MHEILKTAIHDLIDRCNDPITLKEIFNFLNSKVESADWWHGLNQTQQRITRASIQQANEGKVIAHEVVSVKIRKKINS